MPGAAIALLAALLALGAPASAAATDPGARPDASLDRQIHTLQLEIVAASAQRAVAGGGIGVANDRLALQQAVATLNADQGAANDAAALLARDHAATVRATAALHADLAGRSRDTAQLAEANRRLSALAVTLYLGTGSPDSANLQAAQLGVEQQDELETVAAAVEQDRATASAAWRAQARRVATAERVLARDRALTRAAGSGRAGAARLLVDADAAVIADRNTLTAALADLTQAQQAEDTAAADFDGPEGSSPDPVPSILGRNALDAQQLTGWFDASGYVAGTQASIGQLAAWYIQEGQAEGVRGDLAFAQAILETGGFSSPDAVERDNFAGIGHCDTCAAGWAFPSDRMGVRAQIQLLRTYATPGLTATQLANPPVLAALDPAKQWVRGCCPTWPSLTGVWASDPVYGRSVLDLYEEMLAWAAG